MKLSEIKKVIIENQDELESFAYKFGSEFYYNLTMGGYLRADSIPNEHPELKHKVAKMNEIGKKLERIRTEVEEMLEEMGINAEF